jgi:tRNA 2-selenouridine synthase SelU
LCDALILKNDIPELIDVLSELPQPRADAVISDAAFVRMKRYRSLFLPTEGSKKRKQIQGASFIHGWNELNLHELLMMKAQRLAGESIDRTAAEELIGQSGFVHFNGLLD